MTLASLAIPVQGTNLLSQFMGSMDKEASFKLMDAYYDMGGNFIDTANN